MSLIKIKAYLRLYQGGRSSAFYSGYRPVFDFVEGMKTSGKIELIDRTEFCPGENGEVKISFIHRKYLGDDFDIGRKFTFGEGKEPLGEGEIIEILL